jgi:hypothetical protein
LLPYRGFSILRSPFRRTRFLLQLLLIYSLLDSALAARSIRPRLEPGFAHAFCETYQGRILDQLRRDAEINLQLKQKRARGVLALSSPPLTKNINDIAVLEDDGSIVSPVNYFDLSNIEIRLTPATNGAYRLTRRTNSLDRTNLGSRLTLSDDDSKEIGFQNGFRVLFFGKSYDKFWVNSDGNITFTEGDSASTDRDLTRFRSGPPRLAAFFADLNPETSPGGGIYFNQLSDRLLVTWDHVRKYGDTGGTQDLSVQVSLFSDGAIELAYDSITVENGIVGWTSGGNNLLVNLADLSALDAALLNGPQAEIFSRSTQVSNTALAQRFYQTHPDRFDQLVVFTNFPYDLGNAFAYELNVKNEIQGIGLEQEISGQPPSAFFDYSSFFGSGGQLQSYLSMNQLAAFPNDPGQIFFGTNSTLSILGQEAGHRWLAYVPFWDNGTSSKEILGRDLDHWSFFLNSEASVMEGNLIRDNGDGSFTTIESTRRYSQLDQYLMGLRPADQVNPFFLVANVSGTRRTSSSAPAEGVAFRGVRRNLSVDDIIAAAGPRIPSAEISPKAFRQAFVLLIQNGTALNDSDLNKITRIKTRWEQFFAQGTDGLGRIDARLGGEVPAPLIQTLFPDFGSTLGGTRIYLSGGHFQSEAQVFFGDTRASHVEFVNSGLLVAIAPPHMAQSINPRVLNPDGQEALSASSFTFQELMPAMVSANSVRIPFAIDSAEYRSNLGINNLSTSPATVKISLLDNHGNLLKQTGGISVPPLGFIQINNILRTLAAASAVTGLEGTLAVESAQEVAAFLAQIDNRSEDPAILEGVRIGDSHLILESATNIGSFRSSLIITNLSPRAGKLTIRALSRKDGNPIGQPLAALPLSPNGYLRFEDVLVDLGIMNDYGPVEIITEDGLPLRAVSLVIDPATRNGGYFPARPPETASQEQFIPFASDGPEFRTNLGLRNPGMRQALIRMELVDGGGKVLASTASALVLPSGQSGQINQIVSYLRQDAAANQSADSRPTYLRLTSDEPVQAYASLINNSNNDPAIEPGISKGGSRLLIPSAANTNFKSSLLILNPGNIPANVLLTARSGDVEEIGETTASQSIMIPAHGFFNTENVLEYLKASFSFGPVEIRTFSGQSLIAVSRAYSETSNAGGFFPAQSLPDLFD